MTRTLRRSLGLIALCAASGAIGWFAHAPSVESDALDSHTRSRIAVIDQHIEEAEPGSILIAGDSHVELQTPSARLCGAPIVNAGISGANASGYGALLSHLNVPLRFRAAILTIGTNDLVSKGDPLSQANADAFEKHVAGIVAQLAAVSDRVVVTAVPPIDRELKGVFDAGAVGGYSQRIAALCARVGCLYADPFASLRDGSSGFGLPGANKTRLHLARYRPVLANLETVLCPAERSSGAAAPEAGQR